MTAHNLLVLSDVHLGSDLVHHVRPEAPARTRGSERRDQELVAFFDWYRDHRRDGRPWRLVVAGDFVDFVGMSVTAPEALRALKDEERDHGLGGAGDHTVLKLRLVVEHHRAVFESLARFVAAGNTLVLLRGNHDVDLHWPEVQAELVRTLAAFGATERDSIELADWFYWEEGVVYVEHGHQYDAYCSYDHVMHPVSPADGTRTSRSLSDVLLRYVVRPTRGLSQTGHDVAGILDYVRFGLRLGASGMAALALRFVRAVAVLVAIHREHVGLAADWVRKEHDRKMRLLGEAKAIGIERLRALASLSRPPVTRSVTLLLASVMLDRIVVAAAAAGLLAAAVVYGGDLAEKLLSVGLVGLVAVVVAVTWGRVRRSVDASAELRGTAQQLAGLFPAAFIVMGHTHLPEVTPVSATGVTYVNLGAWAEEEPDSNDATRLPATRTHFVICHGEGGALGELLQWGADGPERFAPGFDTQASPFVDA